MSRMTVTVDDRLLEEARKLLGLKSKRETITTALSEIVRQKKRERALRNRASINLDIDQEGLEELRRQG